MNPQTQRVAKKKTLIILIVFVLLFIALVATSVFFLVTYKEQKKAVFIPPNASYMAGEVIIQYEEGYGPGEQKHEELYKRLQEIGITSEEKLFESNEKPLRYFYKLTFNTDLSVPQTIEKIQTLPGITTSTPDYIFKTTVTPNDPLYPMQWNYPNIKANTGWDIAKGTSDITVAVVDTGIDYNHPDFQNRTLILGKDFSTCALDVPQQDGRVVCVEIKTEDDDPMDENGHGTHVAGTIAAATDNNLGVSGVTWQGKLMAVKVMAPNGSGSYAEIVKGIEYAILNDADVINMSFGGPGTCDIFDPLFAKAYEKNIVLVAASGNDGREVLYDAPSLCKSVIVVGATDKDGKRALFSNWGNSITLSAPGVDILSLKASSCISPSCRDGQKVVDGQYLFMSGTSMAAPHVSGAAGVLLGANNKLLPSELKECLVNGADIIQTDLPIGKLLNLKKSLDACVVSPTPTPTKTPTLTPTSTRSPTPSPSPAVSLGSCSASITGIDARNNDYNLVTLSFSGIGGRIYLQMGQKGSEKKSSNRFEQNGFFSENNLKGVGISDLSKAKSSNNGLDVFESTTISVKPSGDSLFSNAPFKIYDWFKQYKKNSSVVPTSTNPTDFIQGIDTAWWYLLDSCEGKNSQGDTVCSKANIQVKIPKDTSAYFLCNVRDNSTVGKDVLICSGNPICSYNGGPDVGRLETNGCRSWITSCSGSDFASFVPDQTGVNVGTFEPVNGVRR